MDAPLKPHGYVPDYQAMGDCAVCGHVAESPLHSLTLAATHRPAWTVYYNIVSRESSRWVGTGKEFFDDQRTAQACADRHNASGNCAGCRPFFELQDEEHLGAAHRVRFSRDVAAPQPAMVVIQDPNAPPPFRITDAQFHENPKYWVELSRKQQIIVKSAPDVISMVLGIGPVRFVVADRATTATTEPLITELRQAVDLVEYAKRLPVADAAAFSAAVWLAANVERIIAAIIERDALARFKAFVHDYLDKAGVPHAPESKHTAAGCRIGGRLEWLVKGRV